jgi:hypothetical protein
VKLGYFAESLMHVEMPRLRLVLCQFAKSLFVRKPYLRLKSPDLSWLLALSIVAC